MVWERKGMIRESADDMILGALANPKNQGKRLQATRNAVKGDTEMMEMDDIEIEITKN